MSCKEKRERNLKYTCCGWHMSIDKRTLFVFLCQMTTDCMSSLPSGMCRINQPWVEQKCSVWHRDIVFPQPVSPSNTPSRNSLNIQKIYKHTHAQQKLIQNNIHYILYTFYITIYIFCLEMVHIRGYRGESAQRVCYSQLFSNKRWAPLLAVSP